MKENPPGGFVELGFVRETARGAVRAGTGSKNKAIAVTNLRGRVAALASFGEAASHVLNGLPTA